MHITTQEPAVPLFAFLAAREAAARTAACVDTGPSRKSSTIPLQDTPMIPPVLQSSRTTRAPCEPGMAQSLSQVKPLLLTSAQRAQLLAEPWHFGVIYFCHPTSAACIQAHLSSCFWCFSSRAWAFICCTSMVSGFLRRIYSSWLPMQSCRILLLILRRGA